MKYSEWFVGASKLDSGNPIVFLGWNPLFSNHQLAIMYQLYQLYPLKIPPYVIISSCFKHKLTPRKNDELCRRREHPFRNKAPAAAASHLPKSIQKLGRKSRNEKRSASQKHQPIQKHLSHGPMVIKIPVHWSNINSELLNGCRMEPPVELAFRKEIWLWLNSVGFMVDISRTSFHGGYKNRKTRSTLNLKRDVFSWGFINYLKSHQLFQTLVISFCWKSNKRSTLWLCQT